LTSYVTESMKHIRLSGFNAVRVPYYWEAYVNDPASFMAELELIAKQAQANNICVIFDNHHFNTSSYWNLQVEGKSDGVFQEVHELGGGACCLLLRFGPLAVEAFDLGPVDAADPREAAFDALLLAPRFGGVGPLPRPFEVREGRAGGDAGRAVHVVSDGSDTPYRVHYRDPSFVNMQLLQEILPGHYLPDVIAIMGLVDPVSGGWDK
jgi:hypothetical protein